jgi:hypothetical protein
MVATWFQLLAQSYTYVETRGEDTQVVTRLELLSVIPRFKLAGKEA